MFSSESSSSGEVSLCCLFASCVVVFVGGGEGGMGADCRGVKVGKGEPCVEIRRRAVQVNERCVEILHREIKVGGGERGVEVDGWRVKEGIVVRGCSVGETLDIVVSASSLCGCVDSSLSGD